MEDRRIFEPLSDNKDRQMFELLYDGGMKFKDSSYAYYRFRQIPGMGKQVSISTTLYCLFTASQLNYCLTLNLDSK